MDINVFVQSVTKKIGPQYRNTLTTLTPWATTAATMETWAVAVAASTDGAGAGAGEATDMAAIVPVTVEDTDLLASTEYLKI